MMQMMQLSSRAGLLLGSALCGVLAAACSSSSGGGGSGGSAGIGGSGGASSPVAVCNEFTGIWCDRAAECLSPQHGTAAEIRSGCQANVAAAVDCSRAVGIEPSYPECKTRLESDACSTLFPTPEGVLPQACAGVIKVQ